MRTPPPTPIKRGWNKSVVSYIKSRCSGRIADFTPRMTLADARGKILFVIREDYKSGQWRGVSQGLI